MIPLANPCTCPLQPNSEDEKGPGTAEISKLAPVSSRRKEGLSGAGQSSTHILDSKDSVPQSGKLEADPL